jgi:hypothetical protein
MDADTPSATYIMLSYEDDHWVAEDVERGVSVEASTREGVLAALDSAIKSRCEQRDIGEISPDDPFFSAPTFSSGRSDVSENVDEYLSDL